MVMGTTIAVGNQKGGVAKTTTCISLGAALAEMGHTVLLIDLDPQANLTLSFKLRGTRAENNRRRGVGYPGAGRSETGGIMDALIGNRSLLEVSRQSEIDRLDVAPASRELVLVDKVFYQVSGYQYRLREALQGLDRELAGTGHAYDYVLVDCPPSLATLTLNALTAADLLIIPVQCELYAAHSVRQMVRLADQVREQCSHSLVHRLLITMYDMRNKISRMILEQLRRGRGDELFETIIQVDTKLRESPAYGKPITSYATGSRAAQQYRALAEELVTAEIQAEAAASFVAGDKAEVAASLAAGAEVEAEAYR
jgi:chromosome partitioning protein